MFCHKHLLLIDVCLHVVVNTYLVNGRVTTYLITDYHNEDRFDHRQLHITQLWSQTITIYTDLIKTIILDQPGDIQHKTHSQRSQPCRTFMKYRKLFRNYEFLCYKMNSIFRPRINLI